MLVTLAGLALAAGPAGAATSPTLRLSILHFVSGCHVWATETLTSLGPSTTVTVKPGTNLVIRPNCPMDFALVQRSGPKLALGDATIRRGSTKTIRLARPGIYVLTAKNLQTSAEAGLQTLGPDNTLTLTVRVRR